MLTTKSNSYTFQKSGIWYFSRRIPQDLRQHYRTGRIAYSLRTKSIRDARVRAVSDAAKLDSIGTSCEFPQMTYQASIYSLMLFRSQQLKLPLMPIRLRLLWRFICV
jgi:hypothetical protein